MAEWISTAIMVGAAVSLMLAVFHLAFWGWRHASQPRRPRRTLPQMLSRMLVHIGQRIMWHGIALDNYVVHYRTMCATADWQPRSEREQDEHSQA